MPDIHFNCPKCSQAFDAPQELAAQLIDCPSCKEVIEVPVRSHRVEPPAPAPIPAEPAPARLKLVKCPSCQSDVSTQAAACPKCGHPFVYAGGFKHAGGINLRDPVHRIGLAVCVIFIIGVLYYIHVSVFANSPASAQEAQKLKDFDDSIKAARKASEELDAALHPK